MDNLLSSEAEYESGTEEEAGRGSIRRSGVGGPGDKLVFDVGKTVVLMNQESDIMDTQAVLINPVDSYVGKFMGQFLSSKVVGATLRGSNEGTDVEDEFDGEDGEGSQRRNLTKYWKIIGTLSNAKTAVLPFLWAVMKQDDFDAYLREAAKCRVIIYDVTADPSPERFEEIRNVCDALRARVEIFNQPRVFIVVSSLHSWSHTKKNQDEDIFTEDDYRRRHTKPLYRELQLLERYVVASGKMTKGKLKAYVLGAGAIYGGEESPLHHLFMSAWHNAKYLPIYGSGKNFMPTIYNQDLAKMVQNVMDAPPKLQRYLIAVDPIICQQDQIVKAVSRVLGTGGAKRVPEEDIYLNKELTTFQADQHLLDLKIQSAFAMENFNMEFTAEDGFDSVISKICTEYKQSRNLEPLKLCIVGPPGSGKSTIARQISDLYRLNHFTKEDMIKSTIERLKDVAGESAQSDIRGYDVETNETVRKEARNILAEIDETRLASSGTAEMNTTAAEAAESDNEQTTTPNPGKPPSPTESPNYTNITDELFIRIARWRLLSNQCQNQGFVLDGFPENLNQAKMLFQAVDDDIIEAAGGEEMDEGRDILDPRLVPDRVVVLEASDEFLTQRLQFVPAAQLQDKHKEKNFVKTLVEYRETNSVYESTFLYYLDLQELMYYPIDITTGEGQLMQNVIGKLMDMLGKPRNYGLTLEEEEAIKNSQKLERTRVEENAKEDMAMIESRELEDRRANIQQWMEKLAKVKREEYEREEAALVPLRHYLMAHVVPTLTKGLIDVTRARPEDPVEYLAEFLFSNNPGSLNTTLGDNFPKGGK